MHGINQIRSTSTRHQAPFLLKNVHLQPTVSGVATELPLQNNVGGALWQVWRSGVLSGVLNRTISASSNAILSHALAHSSNLMP